MPPQKKPDIREIVDRLTIDTICRAYNIQVPQAGKNIKCPLGTHEDKKPSCSLDNKKGRVLFHCHSCGEGGDALDLIMIKNNLDKDDRDDFQQAIKIASDLAGIYTGDEPKPGSSPKKLISPPGNEPFKKEIAEKETTDQNLILAIQKKYYDKKKIDLQKFEVIYLKNQDFAMPMKGETGKLCGYQTGNKFIVKGSKQGCFVAELDPKKEIYIVEGLSDYLSMISAGITNTIGLCSATTPNKTITRIVEYFYIDFGGKEKINICLDYDGIDKATGKPRSSKEGLHGAKKAEILAEIFERFANIYFASKEDTKDISDLYQEGGSKAVGDIFKNNKENIYELKERIRSPERKTDPLFEFINIFLIVFKSISNSLRSTLLV